MTFSPWLGSRPAKEITAPELLAVLRLPNAGTLEEPEKAHIYIEQLHNRNESLEARLRRVEQVLAG